jgi:O-antigen ligase
MKNEGVYNSCNKIIEFGLYALIFFLPFSKAALQTFIWIIIATWLFKKIVAGINKSSDSPNAKLLFCKDVAPINKQLIVFLFICFLSAILSANLSISLKALFTKIIKNALLYFIVLETVYNKRVFKNALVIFVFSAVLISLTAYFQYFKGTDFLRGYSGSIGNIRASFTNRNSFGGWLIVVVPLLLGVIISSELKIKKIMKYALIIILISLLICLILTYSRAAWMGLAISAIFILTYFYKLVTTKLRPVLALSLLFIIVASFFVLPSDIKARIGSTFRLENSTLFRIELWKESLDIIEDFPLLGVGPNNYSKVYPLYSKTKEITYPHNSFLQMATEIGIFGVFSFIYFLIIFFRKAMEKFKETKDYLVLCLSASALAFIIQSFFDVNLYSLQLAALFWIILGMVSSRINVSLKKA